MEDCWVVAGGQVLDLTGLLLASRHEAWTAALVECAGGDLLPPRSSEELAKLQSREGVQVKGQLARRTRLVSIENVLTGSQALLEVPVDETLKEIEERYLKFNFHTGSYTWKRLGKVLDMNKTLEGNGIVDETVELRRVGLDEKQHLPVLHVFFNDDLTEA
jgi:hypothetical protein